MVRIKCNINDPNEIIGISGGTKEFQHDLHAIIDCANLIVLTSFVLLGLGFCLEILSFCFHSFRCDNKWFRKITHPE